MLRHASLDMNVCYIHVKFHCHGLAQKIKVENSDLIPSF